MSKTPKIQICNGEACTQASTQKYVHEWCLEYFNEDEIGTCSCLGLCHDNYAILYKGKAHSIFAGKSLERIVG